MVRRALEMDPRDVAENAHRDLVRVALKAGAGLAALFAAVAFAGAHFRAPLEQVGHALVARFGLAGMAAGTFLADAFHFPLPPQFYMLAAIAGSASGPASFAAITVGSLLGGFAGFRVSRHLTRVPVAGRVVARTKRSFDMHLQRHGLWALVMASSLPVPYSALCYVAGMYGLPFRAFAILAALRVPRLIAFWFVIRAAWG